MMLATPVVTTAVFLLTTAMQLPMLGAAFIVGTSIGGCCSMGHDKRKRIFSSSDTRLNSAGNNRAQTDGQNKKNRRQQQQRDLKTNGASTAVTNETRKFRKASRPKSFATIRKTLRKEMNNNDEGSDRILEDDVINVKKESGNSVREASTGKKREELKQRIFQLASDTDRGFAFLSSGGENNSRQMKQKKEMSSLIVELSNLNPSKEPAWSYYSNLARQLYFSMMNDKRKNHDNINKTEQKKKDEGGEEKRSSSGIPSLEGKWTLVYTDDPAITSLAGIGVVEGGIGMGRSVFAKLGRIGQEWKPFPDYTVRTVIEWKRPGWVEDLSSKGFSWLVGTADSVVLQKTTVSAEASPNDPNRIGISKIPKTFEVLSPTNTIKPSSSSIALDSKLDLVTDDGLIALDPFRPWRIGLQMAGRDGAYALGEGLFSGLLDDRDDNNKKDASRVTTTTFITKNGLVALNPFQPWTVGLQIAGFMRRQDGLRQRGTKKKKAIEPWKVVEGDKNGNDGEEFSSNNVFRDINEHGLIAGLLRHSPIQLTGPPDSIVSLLEGGAAKTKPYRDGGSGSKNVGGGVTDTDTGFVKRVVDNKSHQQRQQQIILYLDEDIRIIGNSHNNYVTIESRACKDGEECWF